MKLAVHMAFVLSPSKFHFKHTCGSFSSDMLCNCISFSIFRLPFHGKYGPNKCQPCLSIINVGWST